MNNSPVHPANYLQDDEIENPKTSTNSFNVKTILKSIQEFATISHLLRIVGAFIILASMGSFLLQGLEGASDISRFYLMLGQTFILALVGVGLSFVLKEHKGGRAFFNLSLFSIVANFTTLGALIFSTIQWSGNLANNYPLFSDWSLSNGSSLIIPMISSIGLLIPVALFAFSVMARSSAKQLTLLLAINSLLLIFPVRDSLSISVLATIGAAISFLWLKKLASNQTSFRTLEGRMAIGIVFLPLAIMLIRSFWLYQVDDMLYLILALATFFGLRAISQSINNDKSIAKSFIDWLSIACTFVVAVVVCELMLEFVSYNLLGSVFSLVFVLMTFYVARQAGSNKSSFITFASIVLILTHFLQVVAFQNILSGLLCLLAGLAVIAFGKMSHKKHLLTLGLVTSVIGLVLSLVFLFDGINFNNWMSMTTIGVVTIIAASLLERYGAVLKLKWSEWNKLEKE